MKLGLISFLLPFFLILFYSCDRVDDGIDVATVIVSGGLFPLPKNANSLCDLGLAPCPKEELEIIEGEGEGESEITAKNQPPIVEFYRDKLELDVGDERNLLLKIEDPDEDNISKVYYVIEDPTLATLEVVKEPNVINVIAIKGGSTHIRAFALDTNFNEGKTEPLPLNIVNQEDFMTMQVQLAEHLVDMQIRSQAVVRYIYTGLRPGYVANYISDNNLVSVQINPELSSITIRSNTVWGKDRVTFTFTNVDDNSTTQAFLSILVQEPAPEVPDTGGGGDITKPPDVGPPVDVPILEDEWRVYGDKEACKKAYPWSTIAHNYSESNDRTVSKKNSITIQSLTADSTVTLYYKEVSNPLQTPFGYSIISPNDPDKIGQSLGLPLKDGTRDKKRLFVLQFPDEFLNGGKYYLKIKDDCYRGIFPETGFDNDLSKAKKDIKIVVNEDILGQ